MKALAAILAMTMSVQATHSPQRPSVELIAERQLAISQQGSTYTGPGWDRLLAEARDAQFFMVGEQHATADIALFATALHRELARLGYTHSALEVGPWSTAHAERLIRSGPGRLRDYIRAPGHAFTLPFLFFQEEIDLVEQIVAASPDREHALWGTDQEFIGSGAVIGETLAGLAVGESQIHAARDFARRSEADPMLVGSLGAAELDPLAAAFVGNGPALDLIEALRLSSEIYAPFLGRSGSGYAANLRRENYMKLNFVRQFAEAEARLGSPPRVFMKYGGNHAMRGMTGTNVPGFGNFLAEWGLPRGFSMVNVMVDCAGGQALNPQTSQPGPCEPYFGPETLIGSMARRDRMTLIDLRALRPGLRRMTDLDPLSRQTILAFDYYLVIRDVRAATPVAELPAAQ